MFAAYKFTRSKLQSLNEQKQDIAMMDFDNFMCRIKHSADQNMLQQQHPLLAYHYPSTSLLIYSQQLLHNNNRSASSSFQPQLSSGYLSSTPSPQLQQL